MELYKGTYSKMPVSIKMERQTTIHEHTEPDDQTAIQVFGSAEQEEEEDGEA